MIFVFKYSEIGVFGVVQDRRRQAVERDEISDFLILFNDITVDDILSGDKPMLNIFFSETKVNFVFGPSL